MSEKSHIDDMRAAIRGDLERARARGVAIFEQPATRPPPADEPEPTPEPEVAVEADVAAEPETLPEPEILPEPDRRRFRLWRR